MRRRRRVRAAAGPLGLTIASAGDVDYARHGHGYALRRRPEPAIAGLVAQALGPARHVLNVGAGAGSYEPADRRVIAVEPAAAMIAQRPATSRTSSERSPVPFRWPTPPSMPPWPP